MLKLSHIEKILEVLDKLRLEVCPRKNQFCRLKAQPAHYQEYAIIASANRTITPYKDFFKEFYVSQTDAVRRKINYCINVVRTVDRVPKTILKNMGDDDGLYGIRVEVGNNIFRIFCCFDEGSLVILFIGFQKKTPKQQIERAKKIMKENSLNSMIDKTIEL